MAEGVPISWFVITWAVLLSSYRIRYQLAHLLRPYHFFARLTQISGTITSLDDALHSGLDSPCLRLQPERKAQHQCNGQYRRDRVGFPLPCNIWSRAVNWFIKTKEAVCCLTCTQAGGWKHAHRACQH